MFDMPRYHDLAASQHSLVTRRQLLVAGYSSHQCDGMVERKELLAVYRGVYRLAGSARTFEQLVMERVNGRRPTESELEDDLLALLRRYGLPEPVPQHEVNCRRIDFADPDLVLGIEVDSVEAHAAKHDVQRNATKANDLLDW